MDVTSVPSDDDIRNVLAYALERAGGDLRQRAEMLMWPWNTRQSPAYWRDFCERWPLYLGPWGPRAVSPCAAAAVMHAIIRAMSADGNRWATFLGYDRIAERSHVTRKTVQRVLMDWQANSRVPLVSASSPGNSTKGIAHATRRLELIADPLTFAAKRDEARAAKCDEFRARYGDGEFEAVRAVQRTRLLAPDDDPQSDRDLHQGIAAAVERARGRLPRKVVAPMVAATGSLLPRVDRRSRKTTAAGMGRV